MSLFPAAIIFVNPDLTDSTQAVLERQLHISQTMTADEFDAQITSAPDFPDLVQQFNLRILVLRPFDDLTNRDLADVALFIKNGLASVEINKYGPPGSTFEVAKLYWGHLGVY